MCSQPEAVARGQPQPQPPPHPGPLSALPGSPVARCSQSNPIGRRAHDAACTCSVPPPPARHTCRAGLQVRVPACYCQGRHNEASCSHPSTAVVAGGMHSLLLSEAVAAYPGGRVLSACRNTSRSPQACAAPAFSCLPRPLAVCTTCMREQGAAALPLVLSVCQKALYALHQTAIHWRAPNAAQRMR